LKRENVDRDGRGATLSIFWTDGCRREDGFAAPIELRATFSLSPNEAALNSASPNAPAADAAHTDSAPPNAPAPDAAHTERGHAERAAPRRSRLSR
jgi:hypothetical protein